MKKLLFALLLIILPLTAQAEDCPYGLTNDPYPGQCGLYQDANGDYICDLSQDSGVTAQVVSTSSDLEHLITGQELKAQTVTEVASLYKVSSETLRMALESELNAPVTLTDTFQALHDNYDLSPDVAKKIASDLAAGVLPIAAKKTATRNYYMWQITVITLGLYLASLLLVKNKIITPVQNRKFWNLLLLVSFIPTIITSVVILLRLNYGVVLNLATNANFWHIEFGYVMILIAICHSLWHLPYYRSYLAKQKAKN